MNIHLYALCWNEVRLLPYFFSHYEQWINKFYIGDDGSTDGSRQALGMRDDVELVEFNKNEKSFVESAQDFYNDAWKRSRNRCDWVVVCNIDEHLFTPDMAGYLRLSEERGITAIPSVGYQMISEDFPAASGRLCDLVTRGMPWSQMDKISIFNPNALDDIFYSPGRHRASPTGHVIKPAQREVKLLHYKYLGMGYLVHRLRELGTGLSNYDESKGYGHKYRWSPSQVLEDFLEIQKNAIQVL